MRATLLARGVRLDRYPALEQCDLIEAVRREFLIDFGKQAILIMASAKSHDHAMALIERLRKLYFIEAAEQEKRLLADQADELIRLSQYAFRVVPTAGGRGALEIKKK